MISPELLFWYGLALKMVLTAIVVILTSLAVERSGPFIGALIAALPTAAGAAYVILALEHPPSFIATSVVGSAATGAAISIFAAVYAALAQRHGVVLSLAISLAVWFAITALLRTVEWTPLRAIAVNALVYSVTIPLSARYQVSGPPKKFLRTPFDIPLRGLAAAVVVAIVTTASHRIGSFASGIFAVFPIILCSSIVILHPRIGGPATASMLSHAQIPLLGLSLSFVAVHFFAEPLGSWAALAIGLLLTVLWSGALLVFRLAAVRRALGRQSPV